MRLERELAAAPELDAELLRKVKRMGFGDKYIGQVRGMSETDVIRLRESFGIRPVYKMIDSCAGERDTYVP